MSNPLLSMFAGGQPSGLNLDPQLLSSVKRMISMMGAARNPDTVLQQAARQNPMMASVLQMCRGQDPKDVFYRMCRENNIDPNEILKQLK